MAHSETNRPCLRAAIDAFRDAFDVPQAYSPIGAIALHDGKVAVHLAGFGNDRHAEIALGRGIAEIAGVERSRGGLICCGSVCAAQ